MLCSQAFLQQRLWLKACLVVVQCEEVSKVYTRYGKCYTFNGNKTTSRKTKQGGMGNGLEIMLDIQQDEYLPIWKETNETSLEAGIRVQIHSQDEPPYIHQLGFGVSPGFQTFLTYLPQPWGNCRSTSEQMIPGYDTYSISACRLRCETLEVPYVFPRTGCSFDGFWWRCRYLYSQQYQMCGQSTWDNFLVLDIFFEALNYETIEQKKAYDVAGLLGDIGGQMGLFIGASVLTILEILDYVYEVIKHRLERLLRSQRDDKKQTQQQQQASTVATVKLEEMKAKDSGEMSRSHSEGAYANTILPNHHHHHRTHHRVFEDFAC
ncbi:hypothetical protein cypCar_00017635 [Cyprinus carpio]|nr:hypothetical protein cypCar_00017635 [Cyprinus carpio]